MDNQTINKIYCPKCWKEINKEQIRERVKKLREKQNVKGLENPL